MTKTEKQKLLKNRTAQSAYKARMYAAGFKQKMVWVPRDNDEKESTLDRGAFIRKLDELTADWSAAKLSKLFGDLLKIVKAKAKEAEEKKK